MRRVFSITFALIVLLSFTTGVQALEEKTMQRDNGTSAGAYWSKTDGNLTTITDLSLTESLDGTQIILSTYTWDATNGTTVNEYYGYLCTKDDVFSIDKKLNSATLSEVQINVQNGYTGEMKPLNVTVHWTGTGEVSTSSNTFVLKNRDYRVTNTITESHRDATATASINNEDLGQNNDAFLRIFKSTSIYMEK